MPLVPPTPKRPLVDRLQEAADELEIVETASRSGGADTIRSLLLEAVEALATKGYRDRVEDLKRQRYVREGRSVLSEQAPGWSASCDECDAAVEVVEIWARNAVGPPALLARTVRDPVIVAVPCGHGHLTLASAES